MSAFTASAAFQAAEYLKTRQVGSKCEEEIQITAESPKADAVVEEIPRAEEPATEGIEETPKFGDYNGPLLNVMTDDGMKTVDHNGIDVDSGIQYRLSPIQQQEMMLLKRASVEDSAKRAAAKAIAEF